jgi:hypothetical protein
VAQLRLPAIYFTALSISQIRLVSRRIDESLIGKGFEGRNRDLIQLLSWQLPGGTEKETEKP